MSAPQNNTLKIYNSLSGKKEIFTPITAGYVGYVCMWTNRLFSSTPWKL